MRFTFAILLLTLASFTASCTKEPSYLKEQYDTLDMTKTYKNPMLPAELRKKILGTSDETTMTADTREELYQKLTVTAFLVQKTPGILRDRNWKLNYGPGGGTLDFADYVEAEKRGTFYFIIREELEDYDSLEVWYVSNSQKRKIGTESVGTGCGQYLDISKYYQKEMKKEGFSVNTSDARHVSALAGTYFIIVTKEKQKYIAALEVFDSRLNQLMCR